MSKLTYALIAACLACSVGRAQEVQWRYDYNAARREALEKSRPLLLDFGTVNCFWCKKLDASTFKDPAIVQFLNEQYIPLKIDANRDAALADLLQVQSYPTLILAGPDGKILDTLEGFQEGPRLMHQLRRVMTTLAPSGNSREIQEAAQAVKIGDYPRAITLLKQVLLEGKDAQAQNRASQIWQQIEQQATTRLTKARQLEEASRSAEAISQLLDIQKTFAGTQAAVDAGQLIDTLSARPELKNEVRHTKARELLAQAREDFRSQMYLLCLDRCEALVSNYADLLEGAEAAQLAAEIRGNPEWMQQVCNSLTERLATLSLSLAESWIQKGQPQQAVQCLERVAQMFPGSRYADAAQIRLSQIQSQTNLPP
jgi:uncharacterized protein YyaL (SSP411 family)